MVVPIPALRSPGSTRRSAFAAGEQEIAAARHSAATRWLPFILSMIAGGVDAIGYLGLDGLFTAHVTGNIVILVARVLAGARAPVSHLISVPVFVAMLFLAKLLAGRLDRARISPLTPMLLLQLLFLSAFFAVAAVAPVELNSVTTVFAGMLAVCAMATQNVLARVALPSAPSTAVMTTNMTLFALDLGEIWLALDTAAIAKARRRAMDTAIVILGFGLGCAVGAACEAAVGLRAMVLPVALALVAAAMSMTQDSDPAIRPSIVNEERPR